VLFNGIQEPVHGIQPFRGDVQFPFFPLLHEDFPESFNDNVVGVTPSFSESDFLVVPALAISASKLGYIRTSPFLNFREFIKHYT